MKDHRSRYEKTFHYEGGIKEFVEYLNRSTTPLYEQIIYCEGIVNNGVMLKLQCSTMIPTMRTATDL